MQVFNLRILRQTEIPTVFKIYAQLIVLAEPLRHLRFDNCWTNGIHPNAFGGDFERHRSGKTDNRELAGSVNRLSGKMRWMLPILEIS
jgi:hypothetical protein